PLSHLRTIEIHRTYTYQDARRDQRPVDRGPGTECLEPPPRHHRTRRPGSTPSWGGDAAARPERAPAGRPEGAAPPAPRRTPHRRLHRSGGDRPTDPGRVARS